MRADGSGLRTGPGCGRGAGPASAIGRLTAIAHRAATINGDPAPAWITAVLTTRAKALTSATPGDYVPGSAHVKVFLITLRGHFTAREATGPPGAKAPTGRYLSLVIDAKTFQGLDFGIGPNPPPVPPRQPGTGHLSHRPGALTGALLIGADLTAAAQVAADLRGSVVVGRLSRAAPWGVICSPVHAAAATALCW